MIRDTIQKLIRDKVFWASVGITLLFGIFTLIFIETAKKSTNFYGIAQTTPYEIANGFWFISIVGYSLTIGSVLRFFGFGIFGYYPNLIILYFFIILFWSLIVYSILKISIKLLKGSNGSK